MINPKPEEIIRKVSFGELCDICAKGLLKAKPGISTRLASLAGADFARALMRLGKNTTNPVSKSDCIPVQHIETADELLAESLTSFFLGRQDV